MYHQGDRIIWELCLKGDRNAFEALYRKYYPILYNYLKSATPFPKCYLHKEKWTFDS